MRQLEGARCALHFDAPSLATCQRCGRFSCQTCLVVTEPPLCSACGPAVVDPYGLHSSSFEFVPAFVIGFKLVMAELPRLLALAAIFAVPAALVQMVLVKEGDDLRAISSSIRVNSLYEFLVGIIGAQAMLALLIARGEGRTLSLGGAFNEGMQNWTRAVGVRFRSGLIIFGFALLLLVPAFWKSTLIMFSSIAVLRSRDRDALEASESIVRGRFWLCLGFGVSAIAVAFVPMIVLESIIAVVFELLSVPRFPHELLTDFVDRFLTDAVMTSVLYAGYVMLHRTAGVELAPMRWWSARVPPLPSSR
ncbi:MAG: hypothetical protein Q8K32_23935 [Archangium sp.]|nr:hypothetical protein [Archangium sp.]